MKKDKAGAGQISLYSIFDQISNIKHIDKYRSTPKELADQIDDLRTLLQFAQSNYTNKARTILNLSKQYTKSIQSSFIQLNQIQYPLYQIPKYCYPQLAYQTLKRSTKIELEQQQNQQLDWRFVLTQYQLKFLQSKNIDHLNISWEKCYNQNQRCLQIYKMQKSINQNNRNDDNIDFNKSNHPIVIHLGLKIQGQTIVWDVKKVFYYSNLHLQLLKYYQNQLMVFIRQQHLNIQQSQKYVLSILFKSIDFIQLILLYIQLKNTPFNLKNQKQAQMGNTNQHTINPILDLFDQKDIIKFKYLKNKNIKVCFLLDCSTYRPTVILRVEGLNFLKLQVDSEKNQIVVKIKLRANQQEKTLKKFIGSMMKNKLTMNNFIQIVNEVILCIQTYQNLVNQKAKQWKLNLFIQNRSNYLFVFLKSIGMTAIQQHILKNIQVLDSIKYNRSINHINSSGLYIVYESHSSFRNYLPIVTSISGPQNLILKTPSTQLGFLNKMFKLHPNITFQQIMHHICYLQQIQKNQSQSNWLMKLAIMDIYKKDQYIHYAFRNQSTIDKKPLKSLILPNSQLLNSKLYHGPSSKLQQTHNASSTHSKDFNIMIKISENFKNFKFVCHVYMQSPEQVKNQMNSHNISNRLNQIEIPEKYFKDTWRKYIKQRNQSQFLINQFLNMEQLVKTTHFILNHYDFRKYIKGKGESVFRNQQMIVLMDQ